VAADRLAEVLVDGTLINGFNLIHAVSNRHGTRGYNVALIRSPDKGVTWSREIMVDRLLVDEVTDPETGVDVRTGDILPEGGRSRLDPGDAWKRLRCLDGPTLQRFRPRRHPARMTAVAPSRMRAG